MRTPSLLLGLSLLTLGHAAFAAAPLAKGGRKAQATGSRAVVANARIAPGGAWPKELVGHAAIKQALEAWEREATAQRNEHGVAPKARFVITGDPAVGKTTMVRAMAQRFHAMGLTKSPDFEILRPHDLAGVFENQTYARAKEALARAHGTVEIEEAHHLFNPRRFGIRASWAADVLRAIAEHEGPVVLTGYTQAEVTPVESGHPESARVANLFETEFPVAQRLHMAQPSPRELADRLVRHAGRGGLSVSHAAEREAVKTLDTLQAHPEGGALKQLELTSRLRIAVAKRLLLERDRAPRGGPQPKALVTDVRTARETMQRE